MSFVICWPKRNPQCFEKSSHRASSEVCHTKDNDEFETFRQKLCLYVILVFTDRKEYDRQMKALTRSHLKGSDGVTYAMKLRTAKQRSRSRLTSVQKAKINEKRRKADKAIKAGMDQETKKVYSDKMKRKGKLYRKNLKKKQALERANNEGATH